MRTFLVALFGLMIGLSYLKMRGEIPNLKHQIEEFTDKIMEKFK